MLIKRRKKYYLLYENWLVLHLNKLESHSPKDALCQISLKLAKRFWRGRFLIFRKCIFAFWKLSPLGKGQSPSFEQTWIPFTQECIVQSLVEIGPLLLEKKILKMLSMCLCYFVIICSWKRARPLIWINLNPLHLRMLCAKFGWNWPTDLRAADF